MCLFSVLGEWKAIETEIWNAVILRFIGVRSRKLVLQSLDMKCSSSDEGMVLPFQAW